MHAVVLAFGILAGACGSNTSSKEKLDAGQRKYCDAYCADASKDARTIDAGGGTVEVASEAVGAQPDATVYPDALVADVPIGADTAVQRLDARPGVDSLTMDVGSGGAAGQGSGGAAGQSSGGAGAGGSTGVRSDAAEPDLPDAPVDIADAGTDTADAPGDVPSDSADAPADASSDGDAPIGPDASDAPASPDLRLDTGASPTCSIGASKWAHGWARVGPSATKLALAPDGTPWAAGYYFASLDFGGTVLAHTADTKADAFLAKFDPATGQATQAFSFNDVNGSNQYANGVAVASSSNVGVIGYFSGEIDFDGNNSDGSGTPGLDYLQSSASIPYYAVISGSSTGTSATPVLAHMVDLGTGSILSVASNPTQNAFALCGKTSKAVAKWNASGATKGLITTTSGAVAGGGFDIVVAKIDASTGAPVWARQFGGTGDQICESVTLDNTGDVILAGAYTGALDFGGATTAFPTVADTTLGLLYVAKLSGTDGSGLAGKTWGTGGRSDAVAITVDRDNNIIMGGSLGTTVDFGGGVTATYAGLTDAFVVKLSSTLAPVWAKAFGDAAYDQKVQSLGTSSTGDVFIGGSFKGALTGLGLAGSTVSLDAFAAELSGSDGSPRAGSGTGLCAFGYGDDPGAQSISALTVARTATGAVADSVLMVGDFASTVTFGTTELYAEDRSGACTGDSTCAGEPCAPGGFCASATVTESFFTRF
jgi:hypothetical protein